MAIRAGGHIIRESGWELERPPRPTTPARVAEVQAQAPQPADRVTCPDCAKDVATRKDGTPRKHDCVEEGVTDGGDHATEGQ